MNVPWVQWERKASCKHWRAGRHSLPERLLFRVCSPSRSIWPGFSTRLHMVLTTTVGTDNAVFKGLVLKSWWCNNLLLCLDTKCRTDGKTSMFETLFLSWKIFHVACLKLEEMPHTRCFVCSTVFASSCSYPSLPPPHQIGAVGETVCFRVYLNV